MDHLSSCYFCGTAMDDPLGEYRVVPVELRDDDDVTTATLCASCHSKLERLLAPVVEAAGRDGVTLDARGADRQSADAHHDESPTRTDETDEETAADGEEETTTDEESDDAGTEDDSEDTLVDVEASLVDVDDDPLAESDTSGDDDLQEAMDPDVPDELEPGESDGAASDSTATADAESTGTGDGQTETSDGDDEETVRITHTGADERGDEADERDAQTDGEDTAADDGGEAADGEDETDDEDEGEDDAEQNGAGQDGGGTDEDTAQTTVSALEYNKVMRLLQNREFPVDRAEIEGIAANAYGLAEHECAEVIDLAIDRGLIAERDGQLIRPG